MNSYGLVYLYIVVVVVVFFRFCLLFIYSFFFYSIANYLVPPHGADDTHTACFI